MFIAIRAIFLNGAIKMADIYNKFKERSVGACRTFRIELMQAAKNGMGVKEYMEAGRPYRDGKQLIGNAPTKKK